MSNWEKKTHVQAAFASSSSSKKYSMFVGRWQPWHFGHRELINQQLNRGRNILLCVRDVEIDDKNPFSTEWVVNNLEVELKDLIDEGRLVIQVIPDIESINIGRGVGYDVIEHFPPDEIKNISATKIREQMKKDGKL
jgi:nicotinamide mononucleotide adenylyltransferase